MNFKRLRPQEFFKTARSYRLIVLLLFIFVLILGTVIVLSSKTSDILYSLTVPNPTYKTPLIQNNSLSNISPEFPNCDLPCWQSLMVGNSTFEEYQNISQEKFVGFYHIGSQEAWKRVNYSTNEVLRYEIVNLNDSRIGQTINLYFQDDIFKEIYIYPVHANLEMLFEEFGEPSHYIAYHFHELDWSGVVYRLFYLEKGLFVDLASDSGHPKSCTMTIEMNRRLNFVSINPTKENINEFLNSQQAHLPQWETQFVRPWISNENIKISECISHN